MRHVGDMLILLGFIDLGWITLQMLARVPLCMPWLSQAEIKICRQSDPNPITYMVMVATASLVIVVGVWLRRGK
jgi:hypothetical protein